MTLNDLTACVIAVCHEMLQPLMRQASVSRIERVAIADCAKHSTVGNYSCVPYIKSGTIQEGLKPIYSCTAVQIPMMPRYIPANIEKVHPLPASEVLIKTLTDIHLNPECARQRSNASLEHRYGSTGQAIRHIPSSADTCQHRNRSTEK